MDLETCAQLFIAGLNSFSLIFGFLFGFLFWREVFISGGC